MSSWASVRPPGLTAWLSCDEADATPVRFWAAFANAVRVVDPAFGLDAAQLLAMDEEVSADVIASVANDAAMLPAGSAIVVDDFHKAASTVSNSLTDLIERWPAGVQLVLGTRSDPALPLHRLRMSEALCELRNDDLRFSLEHSRLLFANFGVEVGAADLTRLHDATEGWAAALQMAALSIRRANDPGGLARALDLRIREIPDYFISEVLDRQPAEVAQFMLDTSVLCDLTPAACTAVTGRQDSAAMLRTLWAAGLFLVPVDEQRISFRYHHLIKEVLHAELRARDRARERELQLRAGEWFESAGDSRRSARQYLAAGQVERALSRLQEGIIGEFLCDPADLPPPDLSEIGPGLLAAAPDRMLSLAADLLVSGDLANCAKYLDLIDQAGLSASTEPRLAARISGSRAALFAQTGKEDDAVRHAQEARRILDRAQLADDEWVSLTTASLGRVHAYLGDYDAFEREAAIMTRDLSGPVVRVAVAGAQAAAWLEHGSLEKAAKSAAAADEEARMLGFERHFFALDHLRVLAGLALERRDLDAAEHFTERALSLSERRRPAFEFLTLLDRAAIWATRGLVREALSSVDSARTVLDGSGSVMLKRADEIEAVLRLSVGDLASAAQLASRLPSCPRQQLLARIALTADDHQSAAEHLRALPNELTPRRALQAQALRVATAISRADPGAGAMVADLVDAARCGGFCNTIVTTAPQLTGYLIEHSAQPRHDPFMAQLITAALDARAAAADHAPRQQRPAEPLTDAELRVLKLLPTNTYLQMADRLYISRNTVKTHLRSIYHKLVVATRKEAIERAIDLHLL